MLLAVACLAACETGRVAPANSSDGQAAARARMVQEQLVARGIHDPHVLAAMGKVPRHEFVSERYQAHAYDDYPLPIGAQQTISQPYVVAYMTEQLQLTGDERVLEVGTGSGYQAAVLAEICREVYTIEIIDALAARARATLERLGYRTVHVRAGDGYQGWPEVAPFDAIIVTAAPDHVPQPLIDQLKVGGRMIVPVGEVNQSLVRLTKTADGVREERLLPVRFVPMTGAAQTPRH
ncbi:MAG TPA: protein-L-isoaspartate(D-aspartate) O-methyltransferase [Candidatus Margulisiibacteriota bacterium]|nr:protein-L-isoaspartate(D-aspartate) O-methyltransferase [Candidatus Margulisiibacteriota bacterium]